MKGPEKSDFITEIKDRSVLHHSTKDKTEKSRSQHKVKVLQDSQRAGSNLVTQFPVWQNNHTPLEV
jgi:hypothetical protein